MVDYHMNKLLSHCENPGVALLVAVSVHRHPPTRRCVYCAGRRFFNLRPAWTYGVRPWTVLGRVVGILWAPHVIGPDYGSVHGYTDGLCEVAEKNLEVR